MWFNVSAVVCRMIGRFLHLNDKLRGQWCFLEYVIFQSCCYYLTLPYCLSCMQELKGNFCHSVESSHWFIWHPGLFNWIPYLGKFSHTAIMQWLFVDKINIHNQILTDIDHRIKTMQSEQIFFKAAYVPNSSLSLQNCITYWPEFWAFD